MAWLSGFSNRLKLTIQPDNVDSNLTDFPVLVTLSSGTGITVFDATTVFDELSDSQRKQIAITLSNGTTQCPVEIEYWDSVEEKAILWTKVSTVYSSVDTDLYFYYDAFTSENTSYVGDTGDAVAQDVWDSSFDGVWHMSQDPSGGSDCIIDSTSNINHGTPDAAMSTGDLVEGKVGEAINFDGDPEHIDISTIAIGANTTFSWIAESDSSATQQIISGASTSHRMALTPTIVDFRFTGGDIQFTHDVTISDWHMYTLVRTSITQFYLYVDGAPADSGTDGAGSSVSVHNIAGKDFATAWSYYDGRLDEIRFSSDDRTAAWIKADYYSNWNNFIVFQEEAEEEITTSWLTDWSKRIKLTIDHTNIDSRLADFPIAVTVVSGTNTEPVIMDTVVSGGITDNFNAPNGTPPDSSLWTQAGSGGTATTTNNKMRLSIPGVSQSVNLRTGNIYYACGDFDAQIDWEATLGNPSTNTLYTYFAARTGDGTTRCTLYYNWYPNWYFMIHTWDGSNHTEYYATDTHNPTKLRIKRAGSTWSAYKWDGSNWDTLMSASAFIFSTEPVYFYFGLFNAVNYPASTIDFDNFQVTSDWAYYDYSKKIAVTTDDGTTQCPVEIQQWDMMERKAILWTKVPVIYDHKDTDLYLYYDGTKDDNDTYVGTVNSSPAQDVWDSNFKAVYHMNQDPSGGTDVIKNSTLTINHGTSAGTMTSTDLVDGKIGKAIDFDGSDDYINCGTDSSLDNITNITVETNFKAASWGESNFGRMIVKANTGNTDGWQFAVTNVGSLAVYLDYSTTDAAWYSPGGGLSLDTWYYAAFQHTRGSPLKADGKIYIDGDSKTITGIDGVGTVQSDAAENMLIGSRKDLDREFEGILDEVRISNIHRSAAWIKATYYSNWNDLIVYGAEQLRPIFLFNGYVRVEGSPAERAVCLYRRSTGELMDITTSSGNGYFEVGSYYNEYHYVVILPELAETYNLLSYDKIHPEI